MDRWTWKCLAHDLNSEEYTSWLWDIWSFHLIAWEMWKFTQQTYYILCGLTDKLANRVIPIYQLSNSFWKSPLLSGLLNCFHSNNKYRQLTRPLSFISSTAFRRHSIERATPTMSLMSGCRCKLKCHTLYGLNKWFECSVIVILVHNVAENILKYFG